MRTDLHHSGSIQRHRLPKHVNKFNIMNKIQFISQPNIRALPQKERERRWTQYSRKQSLLKQRGLQIQVTKPQKAQPKAILSNRPMKLSECMLNYARVSIDPFDQGVHEVCIPDNHSVRSQKISSYINSQFVIGTNGIGIAALNPWTMLIGDAGAFGGKWDQPLILTSATYSSTQIEIDNAHLAIGELTTANSNSPLLSAAYNTHSMRLVAAGMEVFYTGTTLSQAGAITTLQVEGLSSLSAPTSVNSFRNDPRSATCSVSKGSRCYVSYYPVRDTNLGYYPLVNYEPSNMTAAGLIPPISGVLAPLVIVVTGATPGTTFQVKCIAHFECLFPGAGATKSDSDPIAFPAFQAARTVLVPGPDPSVDLQTVLKETFRNIAGTLSPYLPMLGTAIGAAAGNAQVGASVGSAGKSLLDYILDGNPTSI